MYAHLHMFQDLASIIINQHSTVKTKLTQFNIIWEGMNDIDTWIAENPNAPIELYHPSSREIKIDTYALDHCQQMGQKEEKNDKLNRNMFMHTQSNARTTQVVSTAPIEELGKNLIMEELVNKVQDNMSHRRGVTEATTIVTMT
jgi:hypothetical protein